MLTPYAVNHQTRLRRWAAEIVLHVRRGVWHTTEVEQVLNEIELEKAGRSEVWNAALDAVVRGLKSERDTDQIRAVIASVEFMRKGRSDTEQKGEGTSEKNL